MKKNKLYLFLFFACMVGYMYTAVSYRTDSSAGNATTSVCFIKHTMQIPCPSCGSTRSVISLLHGDITGALYWNPVGLILFTIMLVLPFWILYDTARRSSSLYTFYNRFESFLKRKWVLVPALFLVTGNWIWNIYKDL